LIKVSLKKASVKVTSWLTFQLGSALNEASTAKAVKTFWIWTLSRVQNPDQHLAKSRISSQNHKDAPEMITEQAIILVGG
jgi:hypothetical protein